MTLGFVLNSVSKVVDFARFGWINWDCTLCRVGTVAFGYFSSALLMVNKLLS